MRPDRREFERIPYELKSSYKVYLQKTLKKEELFYGKAEIVNLSGGGLQVRLEDVSSDLLQDLLAQQKKLILEFDIRINNENVKVQGKMMWARQEENTKAGICFVDLGIDEQKMILDYVEQNILKNN